MDVERLRSAFLATVADEAEQRVETCRRECRERLAEAHARAGALVAEARRAGEADAIPEVGQILASARREAHGGILAAQREVYDEFRREALAAAFALRGTPAYAALLQRLAQAARARLGDDAAIDVDPPGAGGVLARSGDRRVDLSLAILVDDCVGGLGDRLGRLWA
jgi:vacuolar-type H+-ATPase subunit E/Vma4